jgi:hypothetical protein
MNLIKHNSNSISCKLVRSHLADLLLDDAFAASHPALAAHLAACADCDAELAGLRSTFAALDEWTAPEPSPYFDTRLHARLREAEAARPEGIFERTWSFFQFSTGRHLRSAMTGALALALLLGGGTSTFLYLQQPAPQASATVNDLRILDKNADALQQMDQLLDDSNAPQSDDGATPPTT